MKIFGMGGIELVIILIVILLIFGPKNLPKLGNALGKTVSNLRAGMSEGKKKKDAEEPASEEDAAEHESGLGQTLELEGKVDEIEAAATDDEPETETATDPEPESESEPEPEPEEASDEPKKVKRVVRKKASAE